MKTNVVYLLGRNLTSMRLQEALLQEKSILLEKKLTVSSHSRDVLVLSQQIESISESINTKEKLKGFAIC